MIAMMMAALLAAGGEAKTTYAFEEMRTQFSSHYKDGEAIDCQVRIDGARAATDCDWIDKVVRAAWQAYTDRPLPTDESVSFETYVRPEGKAITRPRAAPKGGEMLFFQAMSVEVGNDGKIARCEVTFPAGERDRECFWPAYYVFDPLYGNKRAPRHAQASVGVWTEPRFFGQDGIGFGINGNR